MQKCIINLLVKSRGYYIHDITMFSYSWQWRIQRGGGGPFQIYDL